MIQLTIIVALIVQIASFFFSRSVAKHDAAAVNAFTEFGSPEKDQDDFHSSNFMLKFWFGFVIAVMAIEPLGWLKAAALGLSCALIVWAVFDPSLNVMRRHKKAWDYLSNSNKTDRWLIKRFGVKNAGKAKLYIVIAIISLLNILLFLL